MKLLVVDFWFGKTHRRTNRRTLEILSGVTDLLVTDYHGYYDGLEVNGKIEFLEVKCHNERTSKLRQRFRSLYNIYETWSVIKNRDDYDAVLVTGYEVISIALMPFLFGVKKPIFLQYHQHVDQVMLPVKRYFFHLYRNKVHHVFLEESFARYFIRATKTDSGRVHVVHHFMMDRIVDSGKSDGLVLGISSSNDEAVVSEIIKREQESGILKEKGIHLRLRSAEHRYEDSHLTVDHAYLDAASYKKLFDEAEAILVIPKKVEFQHRVSGLIYDALSSKKKVIGIDIEIMRIMNGYAPSMYYIMKDGKDIIDMIQNCVGRDISEEDLNRVRSRHSDAMIQNEYKTMFAHVLGKKN